MTWYPDGYAPAMQAMNAWSAWYTGDTSALTNTYAGSTSNRPAQYSGGIVGTMARLWWGTPTTSVTPARKIHVPVPADIAAAHAGLVMGDAPSITSDDPAQQELLNSVFNSDRASATLVEAAELQSVLGGTYLRIIWRTGTTGTPEIGFDAPRADTALPRFDAFGDLAEVTFTTLVETRNATFYRHCETHAPGHIEHALHKGTTDELGHRVPLTDCEYTAALAEIVDEQSQIITGTQRLTAVYVPGRRPQKLWATKPHLTRYGTSDYTGCEPIFDNIDETWTAWLRDIRLAKSRLIIPDDYLATSGPGAGARFNVDQEIFTRVNVLTNPDAGMSMELITPPIRWAEHKESLEYFMSRAVKFAGLAPETDLIATTATEANMRQIPAVLTRKMKHAHWRAALAALGAAVIEVNGHLTNKAVTVTDVPDVQFSTSVTPDTEKTARVVAMLKAAELISSETAIREVHPAWDEEEVAAELTKISGQMTISDPFTGETEV